jgi:hypothetical protein
MQCNAMPCHTRPAAVEAVPEEVCQYRFLALVRAPECRLDVRLQPRSLVEVVNLAQAERDGVEDPRDLRVLHRQTHRHPIRRMPW